MTDDERFPSPWGDVVLRRGAEVDRAPTGRAATLRAWDGADVLLLERAHELLAPRPAPVRVLVLGDRFGALTCALLRGGADVQVVCDAASAERAVFANLAANGLRSAAVSMVASLDAPDQPDRPPADLVVWNVGRTTAEVEQVASALHTCTHVGTVVLAAGMDKHLPPSTASTLRSISAVDAVTTHPGRRKAHLFEVVTPEAGAGFGTVAPPVWSDIELPEIVGPRGPVRLTGAPGVFSSDRLDLGTRLLLGAIARRESSSAAGPEHVIDLGCGNGALGLAVLCARTDSCVTFVDDSAAALLCAQSNVERNLGDTDRARFVRSDVLRDLMALDPGVTADLVVCNPPFHHTNAVDDDVAWRMFVESRRVLVRGGELWIVGNRHLGYHAKLARLFGSGNVRTLDTHPKFVVLAARR